jgi:hypothetical protein
LRYTHIPIPQYQSNADVFIHANKLERFLIGFYSMLVAVVVTFYSGLSAASFAPSRASIQLGAQSNDLLMDSRATKAESHQHKGKKSRRGAKN